MALTRKVLSKAESIAALDSAFPIRPIDQWTENGQLILDMIDTMLADQTIKTADYTVIINTDSGKTFVSALDGMDFQLPAIAVGNVFTFINTADDAGALLTIKPNASDGIAYLGLVADDKDVFNTKTTSLKGDRITIASGNAVVSWIVTDCRGIWGHEAD